MRRTVLIVSTVSLLGCPSQFDPNDNETSEGSESSAESTTEGNDTETEGDAETDASSSGDTDTTAGESSDTSDAETDTGDTGDTGECPNTDEVCNGIDDDCDGATDEWTPDTNADCMVEVPAGEFQMGCVPTDGGCSDEESPRHAVYLDAFEIDTTEVTQAAYQACVDDGGCTFPSANFMPGAMGDFPVVNVDRDQAIAYCQWRGKQLPTEAQWEKAARGDSDDVYPWGNDSPACELANYGACGLAAHLVGSAPDGASPYGALDMAGNILEWTADWYAADYYDTSPMDNPTGPDSGQFAVTRGGSYVAVAANMRTSNRLFGAPNAQVPTGGLRCAR